MLPLILPPFTVIGNPYTVPAPAQAMSITTVFGTSIQASNLLNPVLPSVVDLTNLPPQTVVGNSTANAGELQCISFAELFDLQTGSYPATVYTNYDPTNVPAYTVIGNVSTTLVGSQLPISLGIIFNLPGLWTPTIPLSGVSPSIWLKADAGVYHDAGSTLATDGQTVEQWNDQSPAGKNATQSTSGQRPTYKANVNGLPAVQFTGADNTQLVAGANSDFEGQEFTVLTVSQMTNPQNNYSAVLCKGDGGSNGVWELSATQGGNMGAQFSTYPNNSFHNDTKIPGSTLPSMFTAIRVSNSLKNFYENGNLVSTGGDSGTALASGTCPLGIGSDGQSGSNLPFSGYIREVLYYPAALSDSDREKAESYLRLRWSIINYPVAMQASEKAAGSTINNCYFTSLDGGAVWSTPNGVTNPTTEYPGLGGSGFSTNTQAISTLFYQNKYWVAFETGVVLGSGSLQGAFTIMSATNPGGPWTWVTDVTIWPSPSATAQVWSPQLFFDNDGSVHAICAAQNGQTYDTAMQYYIVDAQNTALTSWSAATLVTGTSLPANMTDHCLVISNNSPNGKYNIFYHDETLGLMGLLSSNSLKTGWTVALPASGDPFAMSSNSFNPSLIKLGSTWRLFFGGYGQAGYIESNNNWSTWSLPTTFGIFPNLGVSAQFFYENGIIPFSQ